MRHCQELALLDLRGAVELAKGPSRVPPGVPQKRPTGSAPFRSVPDRSNSAESAEETFETVGAGVAPEVNGESDKTRTRDLRLDRPAL